MKIKTIILINLTFLFSSGCVTVSEGIVEPEVQCNRLFNNAGIPLSDNKDKRSQIEYVHCVSNLTNARQNQTAANALKESVLTQWTLITIIILGFISAT